LAALAENYETIQKLNTDVWGISVDSPRELANLSKQEELPFELLSDQDKPLISEWDILNQKERGGIAFPNVHVINQDREIILHSRDSTASRADPQPIIEFLKNHADNPSLRKEIEEDEKQFQWPTLSSLVWGLPRKLGWLTS
jgi:peroxiredoxin